MNMTEMEGVDDHLAHERQKARFDVEERKILCAFQVSDRMARLVASDPVARFLMKTVSRLGSGKKPAGTTAYLGRIEDLLHCHCGVQKADDWLQPSVILEAFENRAGRQCVTCAQNQIAIFGKLFVEKLQQNIPGKGVKQQLLNPCNIYALNLLQKHLCGFLSTGCITRKQASLPNDQLRSL